MADSGTNGELANVASEMLFWRIYSIDRRYAKDGSQAFSTSRSGTSDTLQVWVGGLPSQIVEALRDSRGMARLLMRRISGQLRNASAEEVDQFVEASRPPIERVVEGLGEDHPTLLSLLLSRPTNIIGHPNRRHDWIAYDRLETGPISDYATEAGGYLATALTHLLSSLGPSITPRKHLHDARATHIAAAAHGAFALPTIKFGTPAVTGSQRMPDDLSALESAVAQVGSMTSVDMAITRTPAAWLTAALGEPHDPLRQFQFAFFGLEVLVNKLGSRLEATVLESLGADLGGLPIKDLAWPSPSDSDTPRRNLLFRFVVVAIALSRGTASDDIAAFRRFHRLRNELSHGMKSGAADLESLPSEALTEFLARFVGLASDATRSGGLKL